MTDDEDVKLLLKGIFSELKSIGVHLARQGEQIELLHTSRQVIDRDLAAVDNRTYVSKPSETSSEQPNIVDSGQVFSTESRLGPLLEEGLKRYKANAVPYWSTLYGTHLTNEEHVDVPEEEVRKLEWTSITGDCWRVPHDNRVTFCFLAPLSDSTIVIQVRNFLLHFHRTEETEVHKGGSFNIWDWFDTGVSTHWYPGRKAPEFRQAPNNTTSGEALKDIGSSGTTTLSPLIAPWRRIINMQGLTTLSNCEDSLIKEDLSPGDLCPFLFSDSPETIFHQPTDEMVWRAVTAHLRCQRTAETHHAEMEIKSCVLFHVTFFEILRAKPAGRTELWPCGELHSDGQGNQSTPRQLRESALTIMAIPSRELLSSKFRGIFWTMICLRPSQFPHLYYDEKIDDLARGHTHEMIDEMSGMIYNVLLAVVNRWEEIAEYFDEILSEKKGLLNPQYHDSLLTDDEAFSRSKKYFWAIGFLEEAGNSISDNVCQMQHFVELMKCNPPSTELAWREFQQRIVKHGVTIEKLESLKTRFRSKKKEAMALRDGLFSASAVMESRASTQLGENIRLITFVSIFFLPLTFCTSLWSINDNIFTLSAFATVLPSISICTYVLVFNINKLATIFKPRRRSSVLQKIINFYTNRMQNDEEDIWKERGAAFGSLGSFHKMNNRPSRWRILQFAVRQLLSRKGNLIPKFGNFVPRFSRTRAGGGVMGAPVPLGNLGDIRVKVQVDVESCGESQKDI